MAISHNARGHFFFSLLSCGEVSETQLVLETPLYPSTAFPCPGLQHETVNWVNGLATREVLIWRHVLELPQTEEEEKTRWIKDGQSRETAEEVLAFGCTVRSNSNGIIWVFASEFSNSNQSTLTPILTGLMREHALQLSSHSQTRQ